MSMMVFSCKSNGRHGFWREMHSKKSVILLFSPQIKWKQNVPTIEDISNRMPANRKMLKFVLQSH
jgi:hypothetical protein